MHGEQIYEYNGSLSGNIYKESQINFSFCFSQNKINDFDSQIQSDAQPIQLQSSKIKTRISIYLTQRIWFNSF